MYKVSRSPEVVKWCPRNTIESPEASFWLDDFPDCRCNPGICEHPRPALEASLPLSGLLFAQIFLIAFGDTRPPGKDGCSDDTDVLRSCECAEDAEEFLRRCRYADILTAFVDHGHMALPQLADTGHRLPASPAQNRDVIGENTPRLLDTIRFSLRWSHKANIFCQQREDMVSKPGHVGASCHTNLLHIRWKVTKCNRRHFDSIRIDQVGLSTIRIRLNALIRYPGSCGYIDFSRGGSATKQGSWMSKEEAIDGLDHLRC